MIRKYCSECRKYSYSASSANPWLCADCGADLSQKPILDIYERALEDQNEDGNDDNSSMDFGLKTLKRTPGWLKESELNVITAASFITIS